MRNRILPWATAALTAVSVGTLAPAPASAKFGDEELGKGDSGRDVKVLQRWLTLVGFETDVDGEFGSGTVKALKAYEEANELDVDGTLSTEDAAELRKDAYAENPPGEDGEAEDADAQDAPAAAGATATLSDDGKTAIPPQGAPPEVVEAIEAANKITSKPYKYGGGHGETEDSGYDCSGAVSYALAGAGLLKTPLDSSGLAAFGEAGKGEWITIYGKSSHAYVVIAGLRFDTSGSGTRGEGPRWRTGKRSSAGYAVRHPEGL